MKFGLSRFAIARVKNAEAETQEQEMKGCAYSLKCPLYAKYSEIYVELIEFMRFVQSQRLPVSRSTLQYRAGMAADSHDFTAFKASNGYIQRFLRRSPIGKSIRLHGKGSSFVPMDHAVYMSEFRSTVNEYPISML